jgi:hypothetical protein
MDESRPPGESPLSDDSALPDDHTALPDGGVSVGDPPPLDRDSGGEPTFATVTEDLDVRVHTDVDPRDRQLEDERREFLRLIAGPQALCPKCGTRKSDSSVRRCEQPPLTSTQIIDIADDLMKGKKVKLTDPQSVSAVVKELDSRRLAALEGSLYLKSARIGSLIDWLKTKLYESDREALFNENIQQLKARHGESIDAYDAAVRQWKERRAAFFESCQAECAMLQDRQASEHAELEARWTDPSTQRRFTKRSSQLLQQQAVEQYMVLSGELWAAFEVRRLNQWDEKRETGAKYHDMMESFENARAKLIADQEEEVAKLRTDQEFRYRSLLKDEKIALEVCRKRVAATKRNLEEESDIDRFVARKFKRPVECVLPLSVYDVGEELPPLGRGKGVGGRPDAQATLADGNAKEPAPLQLPPLKVRRFTPQKVTPFRSEDVG